MASERQEHGVLGQPLPVNSVTLPASYDNLLHQL
jgi:hypothetical protein